MSIRSYSQITNYELKVASESGNQEVFKCMIYLVLAAGGVSPSDDSVRIYPGAHPYFCPENISLPSNSFRTGQYGERTYFVYYHERYLQTIVDILRNEKPVMFFFFAATNYSGITSNEERVGEGE